MRPPQQTPSNSPSPRTRRNIQLILSYDGTEYYGWQRQKSDITVQSVLEGALAGIVQEKAVCACAGRTDRGVHAVGQSVTFQTTSRIRTENLVRALNTVLPKDIRVLSARERPEKFHARFSATRRRYSYYLYNDTIVSPFWHRYSHYCPYPVDLALFRRSLACLVGEKDFSSFCSIKDESPVKLRRVYAATVRREAPLIRIDLEADGFLYNMVRIIIGTLLELNKDSRPSSDMKKILAGRNRDLAGPTAPPHGLFFMAVTYGRRRPGRPREVADDGTE